MINFIKPGKTMTYTAPAGGVLSGNGYIIGALFVIATASIAAAAPFEGISSGVFSITKAAEGNLVEGQPLYWDVANARVSIDPTVGLPVGSVANAALNGDAACNVRLHGDSLAGRVLTIRKRFTLAQVNAGATLIPALPGIKVRMHDAKAIAVGGAAGAVTTVDILGTQAAASVKLAAFAQASLTQSAVLTAGSAGAAVLADGASFAPNDIGAGVTVNKTGAAMTTATNIDVIFTYSLE